MTDVSLRTWRPRYAVTFILKLNGSSGPRTRSARLTISSALSAGIAAPPAMTATASAPMRTERFRALMTAIAFLYAPESRHDADPASSSRRQNRRHNRQHRGGDDRLHDYHRTVEDVEGHADGQDRRRRQRDVQAVQ